MARITYGTLVTNPRSTGTFSTSNFARTRERKRGARAEGERAGAGVWPAVTMKERQYHGKARRSDWGYSLDMDYLQASLSAIRKARHVDYTRRQQLGYEGGRETLVIGEEVHGLFGLG